jgi:hypothetical protein
LSISDLPGNCLTWFGRDGFPNSEIGRLLALMHEIDLNGLSDLLKPLCLTKKWGHRFFVLASVGVEDGQRWSFAMCGERRDAQPNAMKGQANCPVLDEHAKLQNGISLGSFVSKAVDGGGFFATGAVIFGSEPVSLSAFSNAFSTASMRS